MSSNACTSVSLEIPPSGTASLYALSSGTVEWEGAGGADGCAGTAATILIGAGSVSEHVGTLRDNAKQYELTSPGVS